MFFITQVNNQGAVHPVNQVTTTTTTTTTPKPNNLTRKIATFVEKVKSLVKDKIVPKVKTLIHNVTSDLKRFYLPTTSTTKDPTFYL